MDSTGHFAQISEAVIEASFRIALRIAECKKPHTIGENRIKPCLVEATKLVLGDEQARNMNSISLGHNCTKPNLRDEQRHFGTGSCRSKSKS